MFRDSKYCIEIQLIQQTPMIHFQVKGKLMAGIGPRVTDVKPKLDKFAIKWYKRSHKDKDIPVEWLTEYDEEKHVDGKKPDHISLNYVMRISAQDNAIPIVEDPMKASQNVYFGNRGRARKYQVFNTAPLTLYIRCFIPELLNLLEECLPTFFLLHNFGTRQDKGFGGFITSGMDAIKAQKLIKQWMNGKTIGKVDYSAISYDANVIANGNLWIKEAGSIYKILKSGINFDGDYIKSALTEYYLQREQGVIFGEKHVMKEKGVAPIVNTKGHDRIYPTKKDNTEERYIRGLFGYGQIQSWFSADQNHQKYQVYNARNDRYEDAKEIIRVKPKSNIIKRVPSPLLFKVVNQCLFIIPEEIEVYGEAFEFIGEKKNLTLRIPKKNEFDMNDFMSWFIQYLENAEKKMRDSLIGSTSHKFEDPRVIKSCFGN